MRDDFFERFKEAKTSKDIAALIAELRGEKTVLKKREAQERIRKKHEREEEKRREQAERITRERRPDLLNPSPLGGEGGSAKR